MGEKTPAKCSGLSYSVSAIIFFFFSLFYVALPFKEGSQASLYLSFLVAPLSFFCVAAWYLSYTKTSFRGFIREQKCHPKYYLVALVLQIGLLSLSELNTLFLRFLGRFGYEGGEITLPSMQGAGFLGVFITVAVLPAIMEELFFRGVLLRGTEGFSLVGKLLLCGGLFAIYHQNPAQTVYQFICGAAFAWVAVRAGSFLPTVLSHFINNGLILILERLGITQFPLPMYATILVLSGICLVGAVVFLCRDKREKVEKKEGYSAFLIPASVGILIFSVSWIATLFVGL